MSGSSDDDGKSTSADGSALKGVSGEDDGNGAVQGLALKSYDTVVHGCSIPKDGGEPGQRVADLDGIHVGGMHVGDGYRGVDREVDQVRGAGGSVRNTRVAPYSDEDVA